MNESEDSDSEELTDQQLARAVTEMLEFIRRDKWEDLKLAAQDDASDVPLQGPAPVSST